MSSVSNLYDLDEHPFLKKNRKKPFIRDVKHTEEICVANFWSNVHHVPRVSSLGGDCKTIDNQNLQLQVENRFMDAMDFFDYSLSRITNDQRDLVGLPVSIDAAKQDAGIDVVDAVTEKEKYIETSQVKKKTDHAEKRLDKVEKKTDEEKTAEEKTAEENSDEKLIDEKLIEDSETTDNNRTTDRKETTNEKETTDEKEKEILVLHCVRSVYCALMDLLRISGSGDNKGLFEYFKSPRMITELESRKIELMKNRLHIPMVLVLSLEKYLEFKLSEMFDEMKTKDILLAGKKWVFIINYIRHHNIMDENLNDPVKVCCTDILHLLCESNVLYSVLEAGDQKTHNNSIQKLFDLKDPFDIRAANNSKIKFSEFLTVAHFAIRTPDFLDFLLDRIEKKFHREICDREVGRQSSIEYYDYYQEILIAILYIYRDVASGKNMNNTEQRIGCSLQYFLTGSDPSYELDVLRAGEVIVTRLIQILLENRKYKRLNNFDVKNICYFLTPEMTLKVLMRLYEFTHGSKVNKVRAACAPDNQNDIHSPPISRLTMLYTLIESVINPFNDKKEDVSIDPCKPPAELSPNARRRDMTTHHCKLDLNAYDLFSKPFIQKEELDSARRRTFQDKDQVNLLMRIEHMRQLHRVANYFMDETSSQWYDELVLRSRLMINSNGTPWEKLIFHPHLCPPIEGYDFILDDNDMSWNILGNIKDENQTQYEHHWKFASELMLLVGMTSYVRSLMDLKSHFILNNFKVYQCVFEKETKVGSYFHGKDLRFPATNDQNRINFKVRLAECLNDLTNYNLNGGVRHHNVKKLKSQLIDFVEYCYETNIWHYIEQFPNQNGLRNKCVRFIPSVAKITFDELIGIKKKMLKSNIHNLKLVIPQIK